MKRHSSQGYRYHRIPQSRIATFDVYSVGLQRHHVAALLEFDVTVTRARIREMRKNGDRISLNAWIIKAIGRALSEHPRVAGFLCSKKELITFDTINISMVVEKDLGSQKVPVPMILENVNAKNPGDITREIEEARLQPINDRDMVLGRRSLRVEQLYYALPGFLRRAVWRWMLRNPKIAFRRMGNVVITSLGMVGRMDGWFIHRSVHPVSFGIGSIMEKPRVVDKEIRIRQVLNMTVLMDHDVVDGAPMVRFIKDLTKYIEQGT